MGTSRRPLAELQAQGAVSSVALFFHVLHLKSDQQLLLWGEPQRGRLQIIPDPSALLP